jgi:hypothetical protein
MTTSTAKAPPLLLPAEHFCAGMFFFLCGAAGLVWVAPDLARGTYLSPRVAGITHLFTLGWITTSIMGALYQFLPVALGESIRSERLAHVTFWLYTPGLVLFVSGLLSGDTALVVAGAALFGTGILLFVANLAATLRAASRRDVTWWALACAAFYLLVTLVLGGALAGNQRWGYLADARVTALGVHVHIALAGWVLLVMVGVAHRLLPMFLLSHGASERYARAAVVLLAVGAGLLALLHHAQPVFARLLPAVLLASGLAAFLMQARAFYTRRHRPVLDPGMRLAAGALTILATALVLAWPVLLFDIAARVTVAYLMSAVLGISLFVAAHYYKIVPFLIWFHRFGPQAQPAGSSLPRAATPIQPKRSVLRIADLYSAPVAFAAGTLLVVGVAGMIAAVGAGTAALTRLAAAVMVAGVGIQACQMLQLARRTT